MTQVLARETVRTASSPERLRVTVVQHGGVLGGAERWQLQLADATDRIALDVITLGAGPAADEWTRRGVPVSVVRSGRGATSVPLTAARVAAALRVARPDVVLAHGVKPALAAAPACRTGGVPLVWVRHDGSFGGWPTKVLDRVTAGQVATGSWLFDGRSPGRPLLLHPPRNTDIVGRDDARVALGLDLAEDRLVAGMGTRIVHGKGIDDAIRALADPASTAWDLAVAGIHDPDDPGEQDRLMVLATELGVERRLRFLGEVDFARNARAFDAILVLTKPTETRPWHREAFGMAAFEGLTAGVPVVVTPPLGAMAREGGIEVRPGAPGAVASALHALADPATRAQCGTAGAGVAASYPDAATAADTLVDFLAGVAHRPGVGLVTSGPAISVVIALHDDEAVITKLLGALVPQLGPSDEIVLVDGGSSAGTVRAVQPYAAYDARVRLVAAPGCDRPGLLNAGVRAAAHDRIACIGAGCIPSRHWLGSFRRAFARHPEVDLWTGVLRSPGHVARAHAALAGDASAGDRSLAFARVAWASVGGFAEDVRPDVAGVVFGRRLVADGRRVATVRDAQVHLAARPALRGRLPRRSEAPGIAATASGALALLRRLVGRARASVSALRGSRTP